MVIDAKGSRPVPNPDQFLPTREEHDLFVGRIKDALTSTGKLAKYSDLELFIPFKNPDASMTCLPKNLTPPFEVMVVLPKGFSRFSRKKAGTRLDYKHGETSIEMSLSSIIPVIDSFLRLTPCEDGSWQTQLTTAYGQKFTDYVPVPKTEGQKNLVLVGMLDREKPVSSAVLTYARDLPVNWENLINPVTKELKPRESLAQVKPAQEPKTQAAEGQVVLTEPAREPEATQELYDRFLYYVKNIVLSERFSENFDPSSLRLHKISITKVETQPEINPESIHLITLIPNEYRNKTGSTIILSSEDLYLGGVTNLLYLLKYDESENDSGQLGLSLYSHFYNKYPDSSTFIVPDRNGDYNILIAALPGSGLLSSTRTMLSGLNFSDEWIRLFGEDERLIDRDLLPSAKDIPLFEAIASVPTWIDADREVEALHSVSKAETAPHERQVPAVQAVEPKHIEQIPTIDPKIAAQIEEARKIMEMITSDPRRAMIYLALKFNEMPASTRWDLEDHARETILLTNKGEQIPFAVIPKQGKITIQSTREMRLGPEMVQMAKNGRLNPFELPFGTDGQNLIVEAYMDEGGDFIAKGKIEGFNTTTYHKEFFEFEVDLADFAHLISALEKDPGEPKTEQKKEPEISSPSEERGSNDLLDYYGFNGTQEPETIFPAEVQKAPARIQAPSGMTRAETEQRQKKAYDLMKSQKAQKGKQGKKK